MQSRGAGLRPWLALALGVGLTPQLLPAIISVNLARGAQNMARRQVIVRRLAAIEDFGSMEVLCADKTGTLTEGRARVRGALAADGASSERVLAMAGPARPRPGARGLAQAG